MEQKVFEFHFKVVGNGNLETSIEKRVDEIKSDGWIIKQISTCSSNKSWSSRSDSDFSYLLRNLYKSSAFVIQDGSFSELPLNFSL